jgi:hypothetical protein
VKQQDEAVAAALTEVLPPTWALWHTAPLPPHTPPGCPRTGWIHEGHPPYRVIAAADPFTLGRISGCEAVPYTGTEPTIDVHEWRKLHR